MSLFQNLKRFFEPINHNKQIYIEWIFVSFLFGVNGVMHVYFLERITYYIIHKPEHLFEILGIYFCSICLFEILNFLLRKWGWVKIEGATSAYVSRKYLSLYTQLDNNYIESLGTGKMINIFTMGVDSWGVLLGQAIELLTRLSVTLIFTIYIIYQTDPYLISVFIVLFITFFFLSKYFNDGLFKYRKIRQLNRAEISRHTVRVLMSKNEINQNNSLNRLTNDITKLFDTDIKINQDMGTIRVFLLRNTPFGMSMVLLLTYFYYGNQVIHNTFELNTFVGLTGSLLIIQRILTENIHSYIDFTKEFIKVQTLWTTFDNAPRLKGYHTGSPFAKEKKDIVIENVSYGYNDTKVFENLSLTIPYGKKTALVGASGGGKTTLMKLIAGYLHPESGHIFVMGNILSETALKSYYPHIGYLTQEPSVFDATIRENLVSAVSSSLDTPVISSEDDNRNDRSKQELEDKLISALKLAHCDFVFELEKGLDTEIGERGVRLSGGQKQRLAIAKIFLKDPEIILLDEPTSALDSFSEEHITKALDELFKNRTVIVIAHRLQTVKKADDIIVLEGGEVVERGDHEELVKKGGIYHRMLELQSGF